ncbi:hypothetical protein LTR10_006483 [Elasticomyces elasticus]|nr:hypothetical protein LTR10_006483 [Elasticomyces elasticus]KAK4973119.1 hypothetical protein LTR42_006413 [Elasticomyces elasticus]
MSNLDYYAYDGVGKQVAELMGYMQAVRVPPNRIECSGQGGWIPKNTDWEVSDELEVQIAQAFENIDLTLRTANVKGGWNQVFSIKSYHVGPIDELVFAAMKQNMAKWMPNHKPIWTMLGVAALGLPAMKVEIDVVAIEEEDKEAAAK